jgi:hypothetical protein
MEAIQQDQEGTAKPRTDGESNMAYDGYGSAKAQAGGGCLVCPEQNMIVEVTLSLTDFDRLPRRINRNGSSEIAQLRKTSNQNTDYLDAINLNNFVFSNNATIPTGLDIAPSPPLSKEESIGIRIPEWRQMHGSHRRRSTRSHIRPRYRIQHATHRTRDS